MSENKKEKREPKEFVEFPLVDGQGNYVSKDRRKTKDLHSKVTITQTEISSSEFKKYFE